MAINNAQAALWFKHKKKMQADGDPRLSLMDHVEGLDQSTRDRLQDQILERTLKNEGRQLEDDRNLADVLLWYGFVEPSDRKSELLTLSGEQVEEHFGVDLDKRRRR